jgi:hypothetical protein
MAKHLRISGENGYLLLPKGLCQRRSSGHPRRSPGPPYLVLRPLGPEKRPCASANSVGNSSEAAGWGRPCPLDLHLDVPDLVDPSVKASPAVALQLLAVPYAFAFFPTHLLPQLVPEVVGRHESAVGLSRRLRALQLPKLLYLKGGPLDRRNGFWWLGGKALTKGEHATRPTSSTSPRRSQAATRAQGPPSSHRSGNSCQRPRPRRGDRRRGPGKVKVGRGCADAGHLRRICAASAEQ